MTEKKVPFTKDQIKKIIEKYPTPFHIYDESGIRKTGQSLLNAFSRLKGFKEYYAVKALPNPVILGIMQDLGFGLDCSSIAELVLCRKIGARGNDIMFTSNNTSRKEFMAAAENGGCLLINKQTPICTPGRKRKPGAAPCWRWGAMDLRDGSK